ncbi:MAG: hypothetical protein J5544_06910 [Clostridia bacterium]|nr:hypothetical protein [Clostridia bacterium]
MKAEAFIRAVGGIGDDKIVKYSAVHPAVYSGSVKDKKAAGGNKRLLFVAAAAALVVAFGIFAAVRFSKTPGGEKQALVPATEPAEQTTPAPTASPTQPTATSVPPQQIVFSSMAAYREFAAAAELDDWAFAEFLRSPRNSYEMNGISVKEDAVRVLNTLGSLPTPVLDGFVFDYLVLCYDTDSAFILYKSDDREGLYIGLAIDLTPSNEDAEAVIEAAGAKLTALPTQNLPELKYLLRADNENDFDQISFYYTNIRSHRVFLRTNASDSFLLKLLSSARYVTIGEYAETIGLSENPPLPNSYIRRFSCSGMDALRAFLSSPELSDDDFLQFIEENGYTDFGIQTKADVAWILKRLDKLPFPTAPEFSFLFIEYDVLMGSFCLAYNWSGGFPGDNNCEFVFSGGPFGNTDALLEEEISSKNVYPIETGPDSPIRRLYMPEDPENADLNVFYAEIDGFFAWIAFPGLSRSEAVNAILSFDFGVLSEIVGK